MDNIQFKEAILNYNFADRILGERKEQNIRGKRVIRFKQCPCCNGKKWHFVYFHETNTYSSFTQCCRGGDAFNYLVNVEKMSSSEAFREISNNVYDSTKLRPVTFDEERKDFKSLHVFYDAISRKYRQLVRRHDNEKYTELIKQYDRNINYVETTLEEVKLAIKFYDKYTDIFINSDFYNDYNYLKDIIDNFNNLYNAEVTAVLELSQRYR
jgi:hypothetical protein